MKPLSFRTLLTLHEASDGNSALDKKKVRKLLVKAICKLLLYSMIIAVAVYLFNVMVCWHIPGCVVNDLVFMEGLVFLFTGILLLVGSGGLSPNTLRASLLAAVADAFYDEDYSISEIVERNSWKAKGHSRGALVLLFSGAIMLALYFVSLM